MADSFAKWPALVNYSLQRSRNRVSIEPRGSRSAELRSACEFGRRIEHLTMFPDMRYDNTSALTIFTFNSGL